MTSLPRSTGRRALPTSPPSSFPSRLTATGSGSGTSDDAKHLGLRGVFDADHLITAAEIRNEIEAVQGEEKRLLDAFNGLEMTTITQYQNRLGRLPPPAVAGAGIDSTWTLVPDRRPRRDHHHHQQQTVVRRGGAGGGGHESDSTSVFSTDSCQTTPSLSVAPPRSLRRLFVPSKAAATDAGGKIPPPSSGASTLSPAAAVPPTQLDIGSSTSLSLSRSNSHRALRALAQERESLEYQSLHEEEDEDANALDKELNDIRRRREEVVARYEARLDYLRAKLKGAEIHEKLLRN
jgi:hypothetical protein